MAKRFAYQTELDDAPVLAVLLPESAHASDPISWGSKPELYNEADLKKVAVTKQARTDEFEKRIIAIWWLTTRPVPFLFRTHDRVMRSLDAGCVGYLLNHYPPDCDPITDAEGVVRAILPRDSMDSLYSPMKDRLLNLIRPA